MSTLSNVWARVDPERLEQWIPAEWRQHRNCILLWQWGVSEWHANITAFDARVILVYVVCVKKTSFFLRNE